MSEHITGTFTIAWDDLVGDLPFPTMREIAESGNDLAGDFLELEVRTYADHPPTVRFLGCYYESDDGRRFCHCCVGEYERLVESGEQPAVRPDLGCGYCDSTGHRLDDDELRRKGLI